MPPQMLRQGRGGTFPQMWFRYAGRRCGQSSAWHRDPVSARAQLRTVGVGLPRPRL